MGIMDKVNAFAAKGWWQALVVKAAEYVIALVVGGAALHYLPAPVSAEIVNGLNNAFGISSTVVL